MIKTLFKELFDFSGAECERDIAKSYALPPSLARHFDWEGYDEEHSVFELNNGTSLACMHELYALATESQPQEYLKTLRQSFEGLFRDVFNQYFDHESPWVLQIYVSDDESLEELQESFLNHITPQAKGTLYTKAYSDILVSHLAFLTQKDGLFIDPMSGGAFKGRIRRIRTVMYRRLHSKSLLPKGKDALSEMLSIRSAFENQLSDIGLRFKRYTEKDFYLWMKPWFSPKGTDHNAYPVDKPIGFDFTQSVFDSCPVSDKEKGLWFFDGLPHQYLPLLGFSKNPEDGHLTAERKMSGSDDPGQAKYYAPMDVLPRGSVFVMTVVMQAQEYRIKQLDILEKRAKKSLDMEATLAGEEAGIAKHMIAHKNYIFPVSMGVYVKGDSVSDLSLKLDKTLSLLKKHGFYPLAPDKDIVKLDGYIRHLPMNYSFVHDRRYLKRSRLCSIKQIASVFPGYGRSRGSGNPGVLNFNRLMEPCCFDPFVDYMNNAHGLLFGTTGSGKSSKSQAILAGLMAVHRPRMVIVDAGASFRYLVQFWERLGLTVNRMEISMQAPQFSLNPFAATHKMLEQVSHIEAHQALLETCEKSWCEAFKNQHRFEAPHKDTDNRDYLMEFLTASIIMITGAEKKEIENLTRQDRFLILEALKIAAKEAVLQGHSAMIPGDLAVALHTMGKTCDNPAVREKLLRMENGLQIFINTPLNALYFNSRAEAMGDADVTWLELGLIKDDKEENIAPRALAFIAMMNNTMSRAEKYNATKENRRTLFFADEVHIVTSHPLTAASFVQCAKMSRKVGLWIWAATQNAADFPEHAKKAVSMFEYILLLWSSKAERQKIAGFMELTESQSAAVHSLRKVKGKYVESLLLSNGAVNLTRDVPPREILALAMTDPNENAERQRLMQEFHCDGVEASLLMAQHMKGEAYDLEKIQELLGESVGENHAR